MSAPARRPTGVASLIAAMRRCVDTASEVHWTNGYRAGRGGMADDEDARLRQKETAQWGRYAITVTDFRRAALRVLREARQSASPKKRRSSQSPAQTATSKKGGKQ